VLGRPGGFEGADQLYNLGGGVDLGHQYGVGAGLCGGSEVGVVPLGADAVDPDRELAVAVLAGGHGGTHTLTGLDLGVGRTTCRPRAGALPVGAADVDGAVDALHQRGDPQVAQPGDQHVERRGADQDGRGDPAKPQRAGPRVVEHLGQRRLVVGAEERLGMTHAHGPERAGSVVDEIGQWLRHRGP
jgi:hypothetical protein